MAEENTTQTALIPADLRVLAPIKLFTKDNMDKVVEAIRVKVALEKPDLTTAKGRKEIASLANQVARSKTFLADIGKGITADWKKQAKAVDTISKEMRDSLDDLKAEVRKPLTDWEEADKERIGKVAKCLEYFTMARMVVAGTSSEDIMVVVNDVDGYEYPDCMDEDDQELLQSEQEETLSILRNLHGAAVTAEKEKAELDLLRKEKEEREAKEKADAKAKEQAERDQRIKDEAAAEAEARAKQAEQDKIDAAKLAEEEKFEAERIAAEDKRLAVEEAERKAKEAVEMAEEARIAKEMAVKAAADKLSANKKHRAKIDSEIKKYLIDFGMDKHMSKNLVELLATGNVPHTSINY